MCWHQRLNFKNIFHLKLNKFSFTCEIICWKIMNFLCKFYGFFISYFAQFLFSQMCVRKTACVFVHSTYRRNDFLYVSIRFNLADDYFGIKTGTKFNGVNHSICSGSDNNLIKHVLFAFELFIRRLIKLPYKGKSFPFLRKSESKYFSTF